VLGLFVAVPSAYLLALQGIRRSMAANDSLVDAVRSKIAQLPTFEFWREQVNAAIVQQPDPR
jgi:hypothetical protein